MRVLGGARDILLAPGFTVRTRLLAAVLLVLAAPSAAIPVLAPIPASDPFDVVDGALSLRASLTDSKLRDLIQERMHQVAAEDASGLLFTAELLEQAGDYRANDYFTAAIAAAEDDAAYELFFADYLRNFRGPQRPLFAAAEEHYFAALAKLSRQARSAPRWSLVRERVLRGLVALYQADGLPITWRQGPASRPFAFLALIARAAASTSDLDEIHDVRDLTAALGRHGGPSSA